jgi:hypothetical protein
MVGRLRCELLLFWVFVRFSWGRRGTAGRVIGGRGRFREDDWLLIPFPVSARMEGFSARSTVDTPILNLPQADVLGVSSLSSSPPSSSIERSISLTSLHARCPSPRLAVSHTPSYHLPCLQTPTFQGCAPSKTRQSLFMTKSSFDLSWSPRSR